MKKKQLVVNPEINLIDKGADAYIVIDESKIRCSNSFILDGKSVVIEDNVSEREYLNRRKYVSNLCDRIIKHYGAKYNDAFKIDFTKEQWVLVLYHWLEPFVCDCFEKYKIIESLDDDVYIVKSSELINNNIVREFSSNVCYSTIYQNNLCADIMDKMGFKVLIQTVDFQLVYERVRDLEKKRKVFFRRLKKIFVNPRIIVDKIKSERNTKNDNEEFKDGEILVVQSRMPKEMEEELLQKSAFKIDFVSERFFNGILTEIISLTERNNTLRKDFFNDFKSENDFEKILNELIQSYIPTSIFEAIPKLYLKASQITSTWKYRKIYHSAHMSEPFLMCCALMKNKEIPICDIQHSAVYADSFCFGFNEYKMFDRFLTWGWKPVNIPFLCEMRSVAMSRLPLKNESSHAYSKGKILLAAGYPLLCDGGCGASFRYYLDEEKRFINALSEEYRRRLVIRIDINDGLTDLHIWCKKHFPYIRFESLGDKSFSESLMESDLLVCDYYGSPHLEAMMLNKPFVMFNGVRYYVENPDIKKELMILKQYEIFAENGQEMADIIMEHNNFDEWFNNQEVKIAVENYKNLVTGYDKNIINTWLDEFLGD